MLPDTDLQGAINSAERIRRAVEASAFPGLPAGRALYDGKAAGRNTVVAAG